MAKSFAPRTVLKHISNEVLKAFFTHRGELQDVPWDKLTARKIDPIFEAWQSLPSEQRQEVHLVLQDVNALATEAGINVLVEQINGQMPQAREQFEKLASRHDKALWVYLHAPEAFAEARIFAEADALARGSGWVKSNGFPKAPLNVDEGFKQALADELTDHYWPTEMRGRYCTIEHYARGNGTDYFFAYLDDYPDTNMHFEDDGSAVIKADRYAFENVFAFNPNEGTLELFAKGGTKIHKALRNAFSMAAFHEPAEPPDPSKPAFTLDHLLDPDFPLEVDPADGVAEARITAMTLQFRDSRRRIRLEADPAANKQDIYTMMDRYLKMENLSAAKVWVRQVTFQLTFHSDGTRRSKTMSFYVSSPGACNLKSKPDSKRVIGERCLRRWEVARD